MPPKQIRERPSDADKLVVRKWIEAGAPPFPTTEGRPNISVKQVLTAIRSAQDTFSLITPAFCVAYVEAWLRDRQWWVDYLDTMPDSMPIEEAVTKLGLPASYLSKVENGTRRLDVVELIQIADAIGIDAAELVRELQEKMAAR